MPSCDSVLSHPLALKRNEHRRAQLAYLPIEGIGANGNFFFRVSTYVRGSQLFVSVRGYTPAMDNLAYRDAIKFHGNVRLLAGNRQILLRVLNTDEPGFWPNDQYVAIGSTTLCLPSEIDSNWFVEVRVGYQFNTGNGFVTPLPSHGRLRIPVGG